MKGIRRVTGALRRLSRRRPAVRLAGDEPDLRGRARVRGRVTVRSTRRLIEDDGLQRQMAANVVERFEELVRQRERQLESLLRFIEA